MKEYTSEEILEKILKLGFSFNKEINYIKYYKHENNIIPIISIGIRSGIIYTYDEYNVIEIYSYDKFIKTFEHLF